jgi:hypothetical protein
MIYICLDLRRLEEEAAHRGAKGIVLSRGHRVARSVRFLPLHERALDEHDSLIALGFFTAAAGAYAFTAGSPLGVGVLLTSRTSARLPAFALARMLEHQCRLHFSSPSAVESERVRLSARPSATIEL